MSSCLNKQKAVAALHEGIGTLQAQATAMRLNAARYWRPQALNWNTMRATKPCITEIEKMIVDDKKWNMVLAMPLYIEDLMRVPPEEDAEVVGLEDQRPPEYDAVPNLFQGGSSDWHLQSGGSDAKPTAYCSPFPSFQRVRYWMCTSTLPNEGLWGKKCVRQTPDNIVESLRHWADTYTSIAGEP